MSRPRISGGTARGRALETPPSGTRPTPAKVRTAVFDSLQFREPGRFLDLFSGSGAMGLEAASRGWQATCVELNRRASAVISRNARNLGLDVNVVTGDALRYVREEGCFDVVFVSPPYPLDLAPVFRAILTSGAASAGGVYLLQHPTSFHLDGQDLPPTGSLRRRTYGTNTLSEIRLSA